MADDNRLEELFSEFLKIYKFMNHAQIIEALTVELGDDTKKKIYELSDGNRSTRDIQKILPSGASPATITGYWKQWALRGIAEPAQCKGRFKASFDLAEYGLSVIETTDGGDE